MNGKSTVRTGLSIRQLCLPFAQTAYISGKLAHDLRYANDTDAISLAVMNNHRVVTAHKDLNIVCWNILEGTIRRFAFFSIMKVLSYKEQI